MNILWLDDEAPPSPRIVGDIKVIPATDCAEAARLLATGECLPDWLLVDLIVPQKGWGEKQYEIPGIQFIEYVRRTYADKLRIAVYSVVALPGQRDHALEAGATKVFEKRYRSLLEVLQELRESMSSYFGPSGDEYLTLNERLRILIADHIERHFSSVRPFSIKALIEIYTASLALEHDEEKRLRAYQTLEALRAQPAAIIPKSDEEDSELQGLRELVSAMVEEKRSRGAFDVFLCYNSNDQREVEVIADRLLVSGILPWLDRWQVRPGQRWRVMLEEALAGAKSAAVFVGDNGIGPWQDMEIDSLLQEFSKRKCPVIPVLLSTAPQIPALPLFLRGANWVDFRVNQDSALQMLIWGISGWKTKRTLMVTDEGAGEKNTGES